MRGSARGCSVKRYDVARPAYRILTTRDHVSPIRESASNAETPVDYVRGNAYRGDIVAKW